MWNSDADATTTPVQIYDPHPSKQPNDAATARKDAFVTVTLL